MHFEFDETELSFQEHIRRYATDKVAPHSKRWDQGDRLTTEDLVGLAELGLMGLAIPEEFGGAKASYVMGGIASEEIGRADHTLTLFVQITQIVTELIASYGSQELKSAYLPKVAQGRSIISFALTEPGAGSDAASIRTTAKREGDQWVIRG
ncbi:acyl-CoA dehydrogenase family protein, partial [Myxococcota bacterium]|nr:acyl-CoA dehydrogenase family protein [Myxococcota bacterium]